MLFFVKVLVSGFRTPFTLHQVPETLFLNGGIKEFVHLKKKKKKKLFGYYLFGGPVECFAKWIKYLTKIHLI